MEQTSGRALLCILLWIGRSSRLLRCRGMGAIFYGANCQWGGFPGQASGTANDNGHGNVVFVSVFWL